MINYDKYLCDHLNNICDWRSNNISAKLWFVTRLIGSCFIGIVCICGDYLMNQYSTSPRLWLAIIDNTTHGLVGLLVAVVIISYFHDQLSTVEKNISLLLTYIFSCIIDIDHFIEAQSTKLEEAVSLSHRAFLHNTTIIIVLFCIVIVVRRKRQHFSKKLLLLIPLTGIFTHHTRDAVRRGYWLYPYGSTPILTYPLYILVSIITPNLYYLVNNHKNYINFNNNSFLV